MQRNPLAGLGAEIADLRSVHVVGRVTGIDDGLVRIGGVSDSAALGDRVRLFRRDGATVPGEVVRLGEADVTVLPEALPEGIARGDRAVLKGASGIAPSDDWIGRVVDPYGRPLDGRPLFPGTAPRDLRAPPPAAARRRAFGQRMETGMAVFNTFLPLVRGQRMGLFAGSGVGKSKLLGGLARGAAADVIVIALIGERGRELSEFIRDVLGPEGMARAVVVAATSDMSPLARRRCAWTAMAVAEHFRDAGRHVLFLADSITRFAEAHREIATVSGELPVLRGFPASTGHLITSLCERAGPGSDGTGDITAVFSVLVAGSDMEEPIADILRGVLDGHVVLDREIAERGRFPAIDVLRSVSRSLPGAANDDENALLAQARKLLSLYARSENMIRAGLYSEGQDAELDQAVRAWPELDAFLAEAGGTPVRASFNHLSVILRRAGVSLSKGDQRPPVGRDTFAGTAP
ncbi:MAG: FliI/YscN family ATPase [Roseovarius sp.]|nr:FliI/YscN family ATPase [Roseovarius sp.]